jgi:hypothetical protein
MFIPDPDLDFLPIPDQERLHVTHRFRTRTSGTGFDPDLVLDPTLIQTFCKSNLTLT